MSSAHKSTLSSHWIGIAGVGLLAGVAMTSVQGCDPDSLAEPCGPCGSIISGQLSISGNARLDGFFTAVADLGKATASIQGEFEANVRALAELYGMAEGEVNAAFIAELKGNIQADFQANVSGGIEIVFRPPSCQADINVAVEAQASCEVNAECDVEVNPGEVSVECSGTCSGSCEGTCMGEVNCQGPAIGAECDLGCEGSCELSAAAGCEGTCRGSCDGECSLMNAAGECEGQCDGMCMGTCELAAKAMCGGTCHGTCSATVTPPSCMAEVSCNAQCMGSCGGSCAGSVTPPSASANCEASADCEAQASAQAEANVSCTPPSLDWQFSFNAGIDAAGQAAFTARLGELRVRGTAILQGLARAQALFTGEVNGEVVFDPSPIVNISGQIQGLISAGFSGELEIAVGRLPCVLPAFQEAGQLMGEITGEFGASVALQADLGASLLSPMG